MWKNASLRAAKALTDTSFLIKESCIIQQIRTTYILKRKFAPRLHKNGNNPKPLQSRHYVYELIKDTSVEKQPPIDVILTTYVEGLGNSGDKVEVKPLYGYNNLLLPGLAVYATPENVEKYKADDSKPVKEYSSANSLAVMKCLSRVVLSVVMNKDHPWTIQPWHIKASFRKCGYVVPEEAVTLPDKPISGPDINLENKEFYVTVTINKTERVNVRCRIHHWSTDIKERIPHIEKFWEQQSQPVYEEFQHVLEEIPQKQTKVRI